jgi:hypothetical protein
MSLRVERSPRPRGRSATRGNQFANFFLPREGQRSASTIAARPVNGCTLLCPLRGKTREGRPASTGCATLKAASLTRSDIPSPRWGEEPQPLDEPAPLLLFTNA